MKVTHYSGYDGWRVRLETEGNPVLFSVRGAFIAGFRLMRVAISAWLEQKFLGGWA